MNYCFSRSNLSQSHDALHTNAHASFLSLFPLHDSRVTSKASFLSFFLSILFTSGPDPLHEFCPILSYFPFSFFFSFKFYFKYFKRNISQIFSNHPVPLEIENPKRIPFNFPRERLLLISYYNPTLC